MTNLSHPNQFNGICFLDRDGTINVNTGYPHRCDELELLPNAAAGIRLLNDHHIAVVVVTNQSGVGRGYFEEADVKQFHQCLQADLLRQSAHIDAWRYCPHHPDAGCVCRKPATGMIDDLVDLGFEHMFFVGDSVSDMACARSAGVTAIALTNTDAEHFEDVIAVKDLYEAATFILEHTSPFQKVSP
ncbi:MAG: D-glycero-alpha-D-manno-heptose-1,7-bisphosphate 7-phosphatase [Myxococcota bacterium]